MSTLVILAAGLARRYGRIPAVPKQLDPVGPAGEWLMEYAITDAVGAGLDRLIVVTRGELRSAIEARLASLGVPVSVLEQPADRLPPGRTKPWGTAHAILAARQARGLGPYLALNADDFYGRDCFTRLAGWLGRVHPGTSPLAIAGAGYRLRDTLSPSGGVSRAVCESDGRWLTRLTEVGDIADTPTGLRGRDEAGNELALEDDGIVSMNAWAFPDAFFRLLQRAFERFLERYGRSPDREFRLSTVVNSLIAAGDLRVEIVPTAAQWVGLTHPGDRTRVMAHLQSLVNKGQYPSPLFQRA